MSLIVMTVMEKKTFSRYTAYSFTETANEGWPQTPSKPRDTKRLLTVAVRDRPGAAAVITASVQQKQNRKTHRSGNSVSRHTTVT